MTQECSIWGHIKVTMTQNSERKKSQLYWNRKMWYLKITMSQNCEKKNVTVIIRLKYVIERTYKIYYDTKFWKEEPQL